MAGGDPGTFVDEAGPALPTNPIRHPHINRAIADHAGDYLARLQFRAGTD
jgi:hypothetical protein